MLYETRKLMAVTMAVALGVSLGAGPTVAQDPPEHPEHPEASESAGSGAGHMEMSAKAPITKEALATAIKDWIANDSKLKGGYFCVFDKEANAPLALELVKVHEDKLASLSPSLHFACADFKATNGKLYDIDVFMHGDDVNDLKVTDVTVHKENGLPRYTWTEKHGIWTKKPVEGHAH